MPDSYDPAWLEQRGHSSFRPDEREEAQAMTAAWQASAWVEVSQEPGTLILRLCGELDIASRPVIEPEITAAIANAPAVVLDLAKLRFCDSSGIALMISAHEKSQVAGHPLTVVNVAPSVARAFAMSGVDRVLNIV
jgi:anti-sigma B factor antagonist